MAVPINIIDGDGSDTAAKVTSDRSLVVVPQSFPTLDPQKTKPFRQFLTDNGMTSGSEDLGVDGSVTVQDFYIMASEEDDRYITQLSFILGYGGTAALYQFADGTALVNGLRIFYTSKRGENDIADVHANYDLIRARREPLASDWQARNFDAINDWGYIGTLDLTDSIPPYGVKLDRRSRQRLVVQIQDDLSGVADLFNFNAIGFDRFEV